MLIAAQIMLSLGVLVAALQPAPRMAQEAAQQTGLGAWLADSAAQLTAVGQEGWGTPKAALAQGITRRLQPNGVTNPRVNQSDATIVVNTSADNATAGDHTCTLREAITNANQNSDTTGGDCLSGSSAIVDTITFNLPGAGPYTIAPMSALPAITDTVTIDGSTQPGASCSPRTLLIEISSASIRANGLTLAAGSDGSTVRGLAINRFTASGVGLGDGIHVDANGITIQCNHLGVNVAGTTAHSNDAGISLADGVADILIGGVTAADRNLISGNFDGILGGSVNGVVIQGNYIGADITGAVDLGNINDGIQIRGHTTIGGATAGAGNLIAGNGHDGIQIDGAGVISGNLIGTNSSGTSAIPNGVGIYLTGATGVTVGGANALARNLISGNTTDGILVAHDAGNHIIQGNTIGADITGTADLGNGANGVVLSGFANLLGGSVAGAGNLISGNNGSGVQLNFGVKATIAAHDNRVQGNTIGADVTGTDAIGNTQNGVLINGGAFNNLIGADGDGNNDAAERNLISGNVYNGLWITGAGTAGNIVAGNYIGVDITGAAALANICSGVVVTAGAANNRIGTNGDGVNDAAERNLISSNGGDGVYIASATANIVAGNYIGTDVTGAAALGNAKDGIEMSTSAAYNRIGADGNGIADEAERNLISGNGAYGILLQAGAFANTIAGNTIGGYGSSAIALGNSLDGISIAGGANYNRIGGSYPAQQNVIAHNGRAGVSLAPDAGSDNAILGNSIVSNGSLGIDLGVTGVTANDGGDGDTGANDLLNHPLIRSVSGATVDLSYDVPAGNYLLQIYDNPSGLDATQYGEGETLVYSGVVTITAGGMNHQVVLPTTPSNGGQRLTATLTEELGAGNYGSTSEFSGPDPLANDDSVVVAVDSTENLLAVVANDTTAWYTDTLTLLSVSVPTGGAVTNFSASSITYTAPAVFGSFTFTYIVKNTIGITDRATVTVTVAAVNHAPTIIQPVGSLATITVAENSTAIVDVNTTDDSGVEGNGTLTYTLSGPDGALFTIDANGNLAFLRAPDFEAPTGSSGDNVYSVTVTVTDSGGLTDSVTIEITVTDVAEESVVTLPVKVFLQGPYVQAVGLMTDTLRSQNLLPTRSPYPVTATAAAEVFTVTGNNAIVDWVLVEVRDHATPTTTLARQAALLQRDGDVVAVDGSSTLTVTLAAGAYYVSVRHRNHLGVMTGAPVALSENTALVDFSRMSATYGANAQRMVNGVYLLWVGDTDGNGQITAAGPGNDLNFIWGTVLNAPENPAHNHNYIVVGYTGADVNLDGQVIAAGPGNDINYIYSSVLLHPANTTSAANYIIQAGLP